MTGKLITCPAGAFPTRSGCVQTPSTARQAYPLWARWAACLLALLLPAAAPAQSSAALTGVVKDATGAVLPDATVVLKSPAGVVERTSTDGNGNFRFAGVGPGEYELAASRPGFEEESRSLRLNPGQTLNIGMTLRTAAVSETVTVTAAPVYKAERSVTATKTNTPIIDIPAAINVVPRDIIEDQNAIRLFEAVRNVSSVQSGGSFGNRSDGFIVRGFSTSRIAKDGFLAAASFGDVGFLDLANVEQVEVLKGPTSVLYGLNNPGGLINLVTKKPEAEAFYDLDFTFGSYDFFRSDFDVNPPVFGGGSLMFRLNTAYQNAGSFRHFFKDSERAQIAPSLRWTPSERTTADFQVEYFDQDQQFDRGIIAIGDRADVLPRERFLGEDFSQFAADELRFNSIVDHRFNNTWSLRFNGRAADSNADRFSADPRGLQPDGRTLNRRVADLRQNIQNYAAQSNLIGNFETGPLKHELLIGLDGNFTRFDSGFRTAPLAPIDVFNPVFGAQPGEFGGVGTQDRRIDFLGVYLQDLISIGRHWKVLLSGRFDRADTEFERDSQLITDALDEQFSPRAGLVFQPVEGLSLYTSYSESFQPFVFSVSADGTPFEPETGQQVEAGVKKEWLGGRLFTTVAAFELKRQNVLTPDPDNPGFTLQTGEQRSRGFELDLGGQVAEGWSITGSVAFLDAEITEDNRFEVGNRLQNVPRWSSSLWNTYIFQNGPLQGLELGGGVFTAGRREGDLDNTFEAAGYGRVDVFVRYRVNRKLDFSVNVDNLFDNDFIEAPIGRTQVYPGPPRTVFTRIRVGF